MNAYMVFLSVTSQWKESYMKLSRLSLISSRSFWLAQSVVLFIDTCLRRTLFFLFYRCSYLETERCQGRKRSFGLADFRFYRLLNNIRRSTKQPFCQKEELDVSAHAPFSPVYASVPLLCRPLRSRYVRFICYGRWSLTFLSFCRRLRKRARCILFAEI